MTKTNTGDWNTGYRNTGDRNAGNWNTGDWNAGNWNTGDWNTGDWNTGDRHVGCFNTETAIQAYFFNVLCDVDEWVNADKPDWLYRPMPTTWVEESSMTDQEKVNNPTFHTTGGYLRVNDMADEWANAYSGASETDIQKVRDLPNFDASVFNAITGIDLSCENVDCTGKVIEVDGVKYTLVRA